MVRILSDLHIGHPGSHVRDLRQVTPLLEGAERIVFNGDSVEMRFIEDRERGWADAAALQQLCHEAGADSIFVTGNHDPMLTDNHHLELAGGKVFITHGDILFMGVSPWSIEAATLKNAHDKARAALSENASLQQQLEAMRRASLALEHMGHKFQAIQKPGAWKSFTHHLWPLWRPWYILRCWAYTPFLANAFAAKHVPEARFVLIGHTHFSGVWRMGKRVVINTGSYLPLSRSLAVDIEDNYVTVRKIVFEKGAFRFGMGAKRYDMSS